MCGSDLQGQPRGVGGQRADGGVGARGGGRVCRGGGGHGGGGVGGVGGGAVSRHAHCAVLAAAHPPTVCDGLTARRVLAPPRPPARGQQVHCTGRGEGCSYVDK